jgi:hypothetical protein
MSERCPLRIGDPYRPPEVCLKRCGGLWDETVTRSITSGQYDYYGDGVHNIDGAQDEYDDQCTDQDVEFSHDSLTAISEHERDYVIVDACGEGHELGEQGYRFICPFELEH